MAKINEVLEMLIPNGGWATVGENYKDILFIECEPITEKEFNDGFDKYEAWKAQQDEITANAKSNLLNKLGITENEVKLLFG